MTYYTPSQQTAIKEAFELLNRHVDHFLLVVNTAVDSSEIGPGGTATELHGKCNALFGIGMCEYAKEQFLAQSGCRGFTK